MGRGCEGDTFPVYSNNTNQGHGPYSKLCTKRKKPSSTSHCTNQENKVIKILIMSLG